MTTTEPVSDEKEVARAYPAINLRALLLAALITCGLLAITWLSAVLHDTVQ